MDTRTFAIALARVRLPLLWLDGVLFVAAVWLMWPWLWIALSPVLLLSLSVYLWFGKVSAEPIEVRVPVAGRWIALNSPRSRVPSRGLHAYGQTYAIDLVSEPDGESRPSMGWRPVMRGVEEFPAFGRPVLAPCDGTVVRVRQRSRDHRSRNSWFGLLYLFAEGALRELTGPGRIFGNHVVLRLDTGAYAAFAHLRYGSVLPSEGDRVSTGEQIAECGNSGNSSEPHVHFQLMDRGSLLFSAGLPFTFSSTRVEGPSNERVPKNGQAMFASSNTPEAPPAQPR